MKDRKKEHLEIIVEKDVKHRYNYWDDFTLVHNALPELNSQEIETSLEIFGTKLELPIIIAGITGGIREATIINEELAKIASQFQIGMGVGSQRAGLVDTSAEESYQIIKKYNIPLVIANIGAPQLLEWKDSIEQAQRAVAMIDADVLAVHLNFLQEVIQPEGERVARGCITKIKELSTSLTTPVIIKETGAGLSKKTVEKLLDSDIVGVDVGGAGGTSFAAVEKYRAQRRGDHIQEELGDIFWDWGIPTPYSLIEIAELCKEAGMAIVATGGVRHGLDVAKAIALGADAAGVAGTLLICDSLEEKLEIFKCSLKAAMFLTGCKTLANLGEADIWTL